MKPSGCDYVMFEGKWKKSLKFLGITFEPKTEKLRSTTRRGRSLELTLTLGRITMILEELNIPRWIPLIYPGYKKLSSYINRKIEKYIVNFFESSNYHNLFEFYPQIPIFYPPVEEMPYIHPITGKGSWDWYLWIFGDWTSWFDRFSSTDGVFYDVYHKGWDLMLKKIGVDIYGNKMMGNKQKNNPRKWFWDMNEFNKYKMKLKGMFDIKEITKNLYQYIVYFGFETSSVTWHNIVYTKWFGMIMSRMYIGSWGEDVDQNFMIKRTKGSLLWYLFKGKYIWDPQSKESNFVSLDSSLNHLYKIDNWRLTTFNATSLCITYLLSGNSILKKARKFKAISLIEKHQWYKQTYLCTNKQIMGLSCQLNSNKTKKTRRYRLSWYNVWIDSNPHFVQLNEQGMMPPLSRIPRDILKKWPRSLYGKIMYNRRRYWVFNDSIPKNVINIGLKRYKNPSPFVYIGSILTGKSRVILNP
jgi:hypothetical protein